MYYNTHLISNSKKYSKPPKKDYFKWWLLIFTLLGLSTWIIWNMLDYEKSIKRNANGEIIGISDWKQEQFRKDSTKLANCVQYVLLARENGWYERCDSTLGGKIFLYKGEVWKYGVTCEKIAENRYTPQFYTRYNVFMYHQFYGNRFECEVEERRKLHEYPILPENLKRPIQERLVLPIGNCKTQ